MKHILVLILCIYALALDLQKPKTYQGDENITGWVMSEKLDGIRAYWNGSELFTRQGKKINAPKYFTENFPSFELDGELWTKREDFENIQSIVMDKKPSHDWQQITYNIFEVPNAKGNFLKRLNKAKKWFAKNPNKQVNIIKQIKVKDKNHIHKVLEELIAKKAEGLIVKDPKQTYHTGRTPHVLKVKKAQDMEGKIIGINISEKTGILKSLLLELKNGVTFNLGTGFTKKQRIKPPKVGEVVTFKYYGFTKYGKPKFASFLHVRRD
jgi:DNA ligase-1